MNNFFTGNMAVLQARKGCKMSCQSAEASQFRKDLMCISEKYNMSVGNVSQQLNDMIKNQKYLVMHKTPISQNSKDKRWRTRIDGKLIVKTNKEDLEQVIINHYKNLESEEEKQNRTLTTIYPEFISYKDDLSDASLSKFQRYWDYYFKDREISTKPLTELSTSEIVMHMKLIIRERDMKKAYFKNILSFLRCMLDYAYESDYIDVNKVPKLKSFEKTLRNVKENLDGSDDASNITPDSNEYALTEKQLQELILKVENDFIIKKDPKLLAIPILIMTGLRNSELCGLRFSDFDHDKKKLKVRRMQVTIFKEDKTKINGYKIVNHLKTENSCREIDIPQKVLTYVGIIRKRNKELGYPYDDNDYIFWRNNASTDYLNDMCNSRVFDNIIRRYSKKCNFDYIYSPHDLRRTYATQLYLNGTPIKDIQKRLGHTTPDMTLQYIKSISTTEEKAIYTEKAFGHYQSKLV